MKTVDDVKILFVDDEPDLLLALKRFLRRESYQSLFAPGGREALELLAGNQVDIIVSDLRMPEMNGLELLARVKESHPSIIRMILSATREVEQAVEAINQGEVYRFLSKPLQPDQFKKIIRDVVNYHLLVTEKQEMISEIEKRLLQEFPSTELPGSQIASLMIPAGDLSGDFTDYYFYDDKRLDILVGDVMGKGIQSALVAAGIKHKFAKSLATCTPSPGSCSDESFFGNQGMVDMSRVVSNVHEMSIGSFLDLEIFATLDYARIDMEAGKMHLVDCGHPPVIHYRKHTGSCTFLKSTNMPLGLADRQNYQVLTVDLNPGDLVLFYSDGIIETESSSGELYGTGRLVEIIEEYSELPPEPLLEAVWKDVREFNGSDSFSDDLTCVAVRICE